MTRILLHLITVQLVTNICA